MVQNQAMLDDLDHALVHALQIDGRALFARIGTVLGVSTQTVARRYRRLRAEAGLRVVGLAAPHRAGQTQWLVRLTVVPAVAQRVADALVRRTDTTWVKLAGGGTEICVIVHTANGSAPEHGLLLNDIPRTTGITAVSAHQLLHLYHGGPTAWQGRAEVLTDDQRRQLEPATRATQAEATPPTSRCSPRSSETAASAKPSWRPSPAGPPRPSRAGSPTCARRKPFTSTWKSTPGSSARPRKPCCGWR